MLVDLLRYLIAPETWLMAANLASPLSRSVDLGARQDEAAGVPGKSMRWQVTGAHSAKALSRCVRVLLLHAQEVQGGASVSGPPARALIPIVGSLGLVHAVVGGLHCGFK